MVDHSRLSDRWTVCARLHNGLGDVAMGGHADNDRRDHVHPWVRRCSVAQHSGGRPRIHASGASGHAECLCCANDVLDSFWGIDSVARCPSGWRVVRRDCSRNVLVSNRVGSETILVGAIDRYPNGPDGALDVGELLEPPLELLVD